MSQLNTYEHTPVPSDNKPEIASMIELKGKEFFINALLDKFSETVGWLPNPEEFICNMQEEEMKVSKTWLQEHQHAMFMAFYRKFFNGMDKDVIIKTMDILISFGDVDENMWKNIKEKY